MPGLSTQISFAFLNDKITNALKQDLQLNVINIDFSKAFDSLDQSILLLKIHTLSIDINLLYLIRSMQVGRSQRIKINGILSQPFLVESGVPQGAPLGRHLLLGFINDLFSTIHHCDIVAFTDDIKILKEVKQIWMLRC